MNGNTFKEVDISSIINRANNFFKKSSNEQSVSINEENTQENNDIQVIEHYAEFAPGQTQNSHAKTKERIRKIKTIMNGETNNPITYEYNATSYELPVSTPLSAAEIKDKTRAAFMKNDGASTSKSSSSRNKRQKLSHSRNVLHKKKTYALSAPKEKEPSPEIEILSEVLPTKEAPLVPKTGIYKKISTETDLITNDKPSKPLYKSLQARDISVTPKVSTTSTPTRTISTSTRNFNAAGSSTKPSTSKSYTSDQYPLNETVTSSTDMPMVPKVGGETPKQKLTVFDRPSPWTPKRLLEDVTPTKSPPITDATSMTNPLRGVRRLLQDNENEPVVTSPSTSAVVPVDVPEEIVSKFEYLHVFKVLLTDVWKCQQNFNVFNVDDLKVFDLFMSLSEQAKALYVQLLKMKNQWRRITSPSLHYPDISLNLVPVVKELVVQQFLITENDNMTIEEMLDCLKVQEIRALMQGFKLNPRGNKPSLIASLLKYARNQRSIQLTFNKQQNTGSEENSIMKVIEERVKNIMGSCIKIQAHNGNILLRTCLLGTLPTCFQDETLSQLVFRLYQIKTGKLTYPCVTALRETSIFHDRNGLINFQEAHGYLLEVNNLVQLKNWDEIIRVAHRAREKYQILIADLKLCENDRRLPEYLRCFTATDALITVIYIGLESLGRRKRYTDIVEIYRELLAQEIYKIKKRGAWFERLALTLHVHLKDNDQAAAVVMEAMEDARVHLINKVGLSYRASQLLSKGKSWVPVNRVRDALVNYSVPLVNEAPHINCRARSRKSEGQGLRFEYLHDSVDGDEVVVSSVEEFAISFYKKEQGFTEGIHAEGGIILSLFAMLFWDIIYEQKVPDAFITARQEKPLDLYGKEFYDNRKAAIDARLIEMVHWRDDEISIFLKKIWDTHYGKVSIVGWRLFRDLSFVQDILLCIGTQVMANICLRLCLEFRVARSGFPDLMVWIPGTKSYKFVEVKGPGDFLSSNQKVWLHHLQQYGAHAEVCFVQAVPSKFLG